MQEIPQEDAAEAYTLDTATIRGVRAGLGDGDAEALHGIVDTLHDADIADLMEQLDEEERRLFVDLMGTELDGEVLSELDEELRDDVISQMDPDHLADAVKDLETDDLVDLAEDLEDDTKEVFLEALEPDDRAAVESSLQYPDYTAGRLMQREIVTAPEFWTVGQMIDYMRASDHLPDLFHDVIITDPAMKPVGMAPLSRIMGHRRETPLTALMDEDMRLIPVEQGQEDVAYAFNQYHMITAPVVDGAGRLLGVITIDDAMMVQEEEAEEDIKLLAGVGEESLSDKVWATTRARFPWLAVNLVTSILASIVIAQFESTIEAVVALAILLPIVASMGGNAGTQTLTVAVRALATKDLTAANMLRIILRETLVGLGNGMVFAVIIAIVGFVWFGDPTLGLVLGLAMIANLLVAGLAGILIPIGLDRLGADPALASGAFVTTVTDVVGFFAFLGLAAWILL